MTEPRSYRFIEAVDSDGPLVRLRYEVGTPSFRLLDPDGRVVEEVEAKAPVEAEAFMVKEGGRWLVLALTERS